MEKAVFDATIEDLEKVTTPLTEDVRKVYFEHLKNWPAGYMERAVKTLIQTYRARRFPSIPVFRRVLDHIEIKDQMPTAEEVASALDKLPCPSCGDLGWWVEYKTDDDWGVAAGLPRTPHYVATFCQCRHGVKRKEAIESYLNIQKRIEQKQKERAEEVQEPTYQQEDKE
jgi:hypothetical protein